jgi:hypothetical protein
VRLAALVLGSKLELGFELAVASGGDLLLAPEPHPAGRLAKGERLEPETLEVRVVAP